jgi:hypothetical protein
VSGHYRRNETDRWHPFLMKLNRDHALASLSVKDSSNTLAAKARADPRLAVTP